MYLLPIHQLHNNASESHHQDIHSQIHYPAPIHDNCRSASASHSSTLPAVIPLMAPTVSALVLSIVIATASTFHARAKCGIKLPSSLIEAFAMSAS